MTLHQIDSVCDEFEAALRRGDTVIIEDFLPKVEKSQETALLKELLEIEIQYIAERSASDTSIRNMDASLKKRFPEHHDLIHSLFQQISPLRQIGDYEILGELGRGGMGVVYKAKHKLLHQTVAIKVLSQNLLDDSQAVGRFKREMQLIGGLTHPNIVRALNAGEIESTLYLAMEFVDGISLHKLVESVRLMEPQSLDSTTSAKFKESGSAQLPVLPLGAACEAIRQAALGLQNVHELKLVHRDIKPANLMVDHRGTVKILDLGLGKFAEERREDYHSSLTMAGMVLGTVDYISPEQCENSREADIRSDLYSLGCTFYFLLTGKPVYSGSRYDSMRKKLMAHIVGELPSLRSVFPEIPKGIETILQKAVAKDPAERFQTPLEFAEALAPYASPDELWTLLQEVIPADVSSPRTDSWYSNNPYGSFHSLKPHIAPPPVSRLKRIAFFTALNLLICGLVIGAAFYFYTSYQARQISALRTGASQAARNAAQHWEQWRMGEAHAEYQKAALTALEDYGKTKLNCLPGVVTEYRFQAIMAQWYHGDSARARQELQTMLNRVDDTIIQDGESDQTLLGHKKSILERMGDFVLFGGAASGSNRERFANGISRYEEATRVPTLNSHNTVIRWKQAVLLMQNGELERAETLMRENLRSKEDLFCQLAEAVLFYYQREESADRDEKLRAFQRQFALPSNANRETATQPGTLELLMFCGELLIADSIQKGNWQVLADDFAAINNASGNFLRQYPGATPFMRRFNELLLHSVVLLHNHSAQRRHLDNIARILERMRNAPAGEASTVIYFFLPASGAEKSFVLFYPQDSREGTLYPLPLTRAMVRQGGQVPPLDEKLLEQVKSESKVRISWEDTASWARDEDAMTEKNYPYSSELPLRGSR